MRRSTQILLIHSIFNCCQQAITVAQCTYKAYNNYIFMLTQCIKSITHLYFKFIIFLNPFLLTNISKSSTAYISTIYKYVSTKLQVFTPLHVYSVYYIIHIQIDNTILYTFTYNSTLHYNSNNNIYQKQTPTHGRVSTSLSSQLFPDAPVVRIVCTTIQTGSPLVPYHSPVNCIPPDIRLVYVIILYIYACNVPDDVVLY